jgi:hypothetical protein
VRFGLSIRNSALLQGETTLDEPRFTRFRFG